MKGTWTKSDQNVLKKNDKNISNVSLTSLMSLI